MFDLISKPFRKSVLVTLISLAAVSLISCDGDRDVQEDLRSSLGDSAPAIVIFGMPPDPVSEQNADWLALLEEFRSRNDSSFSVVYAPAESCPELSEQEACPYAYSMLFVRAEGTAFFHPGAVVEPQVYVFIQQAFAGQDTAELRSFAPTEVTSPIVSEH